MQNNFTRPRGAQLVELGKVCACMRKRVCEVMAPLSTSISIWFHFTALCSRLRQQV